MKRKFKTLEQRILTLKRQVRFIPISISKAMYVLAGKGRILIVIIMSFPFCQPIQIPGLSIPFGVGIALVGMRIAFGKRSWLPKKLLSKKISRSTVNKVTDKALWLIKKIGRFLYPRLPWLSLSPFMKVMNGLLICANGLVLAIPIPIPFINMGFAWSALLLGLGMLENDGVFIISGYVMFLIACALSVLLGFTLKSAL
jgi:hypothetical protein